MKKLMIAICTVFVSASAFAQSYSVEVGASDTTDTVGIQFATIQRFSSMCHLESEVVAVAAASKSQKGKINITARLNPRKMCMHAFGPHRGSVEIVKSLLPAGKYEVFINDESQKVIEIKN